ncbi:MFS transporter [Shimazuella alba]|uniref:MFS transporter n=1 Tax=Shimazuella alba TaxID=2690964 RepID=A0A6I4VTM1_9BACL|nr:MFS transporter [Shimazuella alba]MXQ53848.1 MFS transporter [Shimazuella alba]
MHIYKERNTFIQSITILAVSSILVVSLMYVAIPLIPALENEFHATVNQTVWVNSIYGISYAIGCLIFGIFSDRFHRKSILFLGLAALTITTLAVSFSSSLEWLITLRVIQGVIASSVPVISIAYINDVVSQRYRSLAISILSSSFLLSGILGQLYGQAIGNWLGWRGVFVILAIAYGLILFSFPLLPKGAIPTKEYSFNQMMNHMIRVFKISALVLSFFIMAIIFLSFVTFYSGLGLFIKQKFDMGNQGLMWIRVAGIPSILLSLFASSFIKHFGARQVLITGLLTTGIGLTIGTAAESIPTLAIASIIFVMGIAVANPSVIVIVSELAGKTRGSAVAINAFFAFAGASSGSLVAVYIKSFSFLCLALALILLLAVIITLVFIRIKDSHSKEKLSIGR